MRILSIETSCDDTGISLVEATGSILKPKFKILGDVINSQTKIHEEFGGVFPMMAKKEHQKNLVPLLLTLLKKTKNLKNQQEKILKAKTEKLKAILIKEPELSEYFLKHIIQISKPKIDAICVTEGPGLEPCLWAGINFAQALGKLWGIKVYGVNHMEGHFLTPLLEGQIIKYPALGLLISGGNTFLVSSKKSLTYEIIGDTRDDAIGEAFDKVARILGLPYPGGPAISRLAEQARSRKLKTESFFLPRPMIHTKDLDFSFSGIKTAVLYLKRDLEKEKKWNEEVIKEIAREFEDAVTEVLLKKTEKALVQTGAKCLILGGGVSANKYIRKNMQKLAKKMEVDFLVPKSYLSTDNALMISVAGYLGIKGKKLKEPKKALGDLKLRGK